MLINSINNPKVVPASHVYFENAVGRLLQHPAGTYTAVEYYQGPRQCNDLWAFLTHAGQLLARWGWNAMLAYSPQQAHLTLTLEESDWIATRWQRQGPHAVALLYGAQLLPHDLFAHLSWRGVITTYA